MNSSLVHEYFDNVYVLNLERRTDRKREMVNKLKNLGINAEYINAVDGNLEEIKQEYKAYLEIPFGAEGCHPLEIKRGRKLIVSSGAWGCLKSYEHIIEDAKIKEYQRILCLEDDAIFHKAFENNFKKVIQTISKDWKLIYLGASQREWKIPRDLSYEDPQQLIFDPDQPWYFPQRADGTFGFALDCSVFDLFLSEIKKMNCPVDSGPLRSVCRSYPKKCFVLFPNLIIADVTDGDISHGKSQIEMAKRLKWNLNLYDFQFQNNSNLLNDLVGVNKEKQPELSNQKSKNHRNESWWSKNVVYHLLNRILSFINGKS
ncbi:MAG: glycosyltransferase family 25 protein [Saprospiraceae bacterium]|nr:glycosyltransferase family 25 protein [Saprospiraceae bacterium]